MEVNRIHKRASLPAIHHKVDTRLSQDSNSPAIHRSQDFSNPLMVDNHKADSGTVLKTLPMAMMIQKTVVCSKMQAYEEVSFEKSTPFWWWVINGQSSGIDENKKKTDFIFDPISDTIEHWGVVHCILRVSCGHK